MSRSASFRLLRAVAFASVLCLAALPAQGQSIAKYGAEFLAGGIGGRALGMGGAHVGLAQDVSAGYWNPAGLHALAYPELAYMHAERFAGIISFDYGSIALPINARSTVALSFFRSGVDDIPNTLNAIDPETGMPRANAEDFVTRFSAADYAFFLSYARTLNRRLAVGVTGKLIRRSIGDFADAWGYSFDVGVRYRTDRFVFGANLQDASTMLQSWSINDAAFELEAVDPDTGVPYTFEEVFGQAAPEGGTALVLPVARLGSGVVLPVGADNNLTLGLDMDVRFEGLQTYAINLGDLSFHPRVGGEFSYKGVVALRAGIGDVTYSDAYGLEFSPTVGAGLQLKRLTVDYGFGDFAGLVADDLGFSHRISASLSLAGTALHRTGE